MTVDFPKANSFLKKSHLIPELSSIYLKHLRYAVKWLYMSSVGVGEYNGSVAGSTASNATFISLIRFLLIAFFSASALAVYFLIYLEYTATMRLIFAATVLLYAVLSVISFGLCPNDARVQVFVWVSIFVALTFVFYQFPPQGAQTIWSTIYTLIHSAIFMMMSALLLHMSSLLPKENPTVRRHPLIVRHTYIVAIVLSLFSTFLYVNANFHWFSNLPSTVQDVKAFARILVLGFYAYATLGGSILVAYSGYSASSLAAKRQAIAVCAGLMPYGLFRLSAAVAPRLMHLPLYSTVETIVIFLLPVGFFLAIHGFQMFESKIYLRRGILLSVTLALLISAGYIIVLSVQLLFPNIMNSAWSFVVVSIILGFALWPAIRNVSALIDTLFFPERLVSRKLAKDLVERIAEYTDVESLCKVLAENISEGMGSDSVGVYIANEDGSSFDLAGFSGNGRMLWHIDRNSAVRAMSEGKLLTNDGFRDWDHVLSISFRERINALICMAHKKSGEPLSRNELEELRIASVQVSAMIENARLFSLATRDSLTGLLRRAVFEERLATESERSLRDQNKFSVLLIDIDNFKKVNDTYGHPAGDQVLRTIAGVLRDNSRKIDIVARYGGEEFAVLLPSTDRTGAMLVAEKLRSAVAALGIQIQGHSLQPTISIGVTTCRGDLSIDKIVQQSDNALYSAKHAGKNRVEHYLIEK
jgi:diguanylate cyclase (GGDEF)-like protein